MKKIVGYKQITKDIFEEIYEEIPDKTNNMIVEQRIPFIQAIAEVINKYSVENESDTPDFILAKYLNNCLNAYNETVVARDNWFGVDMWTEDKRSRPAPRQDTISKVIETLKKEQDGTKT